MPYIREIPYDESEGLLRELFDQELKSGGEISNDTSIFSLRPDVVPAWENLKNTIRGHMRLRAYELVTIAAALAMDCHY